MSTHFKNAIANLPIGTKFIIFPGDGQVGAKVYIKQSAGVAVDMKTGHCCDFPLTTRVLEIWM